MHFLQYICLFGAIIATHLVYSAPVEQPQGFYEAIKSKCPQVDTVPNYKQQIFFTKCRDIKKILSVKELTLSTFNDVLCLTYYNSVVNFCNNPQVLTKEFLPITTGKDVCANFTQIANLSNNLITSKNCNETCNILDSIEYCNAAYYYSHKNISTTNIKTAAIESVKDTPKVVTNVTKPALTVPDVKTSNEVVTQVKNTDITVKNPEVVSQTDVATKITNPVEQKAEKTNDTPQEISVKTEITQNKIQIQQEGQPKENEAVVTEVSIKVNKIETTKTTSPIPNISEDVDDEMQKEEQEEIAENNFGKVRDSVNVLENMDNMDNIDSDSMDGDSYFFSYFMMACIMLAMVYVAYHNRQKLFALLLEGKRNKRPSRTRRPNSANYHKLDSNLEEAITSDVSKNTPQIIY